MIVFLFNIYLLILFLLVRFKVVPFNLFWKISPLLVLLILTVGLFIPMGWGAPSGPVLVGRHSVQIAPDGEAVATEVRTDEFTAITELTIHAPDHPRFLTPKDMPAEIQSACRETGQPVPEDTAEIVRCALDSLALRYRAVLGWLEELTGGQIATIHIVGGGAQNRQLCQMAANACNRRVLAGPVEATAIGNLMMQAIAAGEVASIPQAREVIRQSFSVEAYEPREVLAWDEAYERFLVISDSMAA